MSFSSTSSFPPLAPLPQLQPPLSNFLNNLASYFRIPQCKIKTETEYRQVIEQLLAVNEKTVPFDLILYLLTAAKPEYNTTNIDTTSVDMFKKLINNIRKHYLDIYFMTCLDDAQFNKENFSHGMLQCSTTSKILFNIFNIDSNFAWNALSNRPNIYKRNIVLTRYTTRGSFIIDNSTSADRTKYVNNIDHDFILFSINNHYYMLQSYYYSYLVSGLNGFKELSLQDFLLLNRIMWEIKQDIDTYNVMKSAGTPINVDAFNKLTANITKNKKKMSFYTGINSDKHGADGDYKDAPYLINNIYVVPFEKIENLVSNVNNNICRKAKQVLDKYSNNNNINFLFDYFVYDAFNKDSIKNDVPSFNTLTGLNVSKLEPLIKSSDDETYYYSIKFNVPINVAKSICQNLRTAFQCFNITACPLPSK